MRFLAALLAAVVLSACAEAPAAEPSVGGDFTLTNHDGRAMSLRELRGKRVLLFFGFTHCPDACPTMLSKISRVHRLLGEDAKDLTTVFISVDPERDTPAALKEYLSYFKVPTIGMTGTKAQIDEVIGMYGGKYTIEPSTSSAGPSVSHTTWLYIVDDEGKVRDRATHASTAEEIVAMVRKLT
jgi:protein SCO1